MESPTPPSKPSTVSKNIARENRSSGKVIGGRKTVARSLQADPRYQSTQKGATSNKANQSYRHPSADDTPTKITSPRNYADDKDRGKTLQGHMAHSPGRMGQKNENTTKRRVRTSPVDSSRISDQCLKTAQPERDCTSILGVLTVSMLVLLASEVYSRTLEREYLTKQLAQQETGFKNAQMVRAQLEDISSQLEKLMIQGNRNASAVVAEMRKAGYHYVSKP